MSTDKKILSLLSDNAKYTNEDIARMLGVKKEEVDSRIADLEGQGIIRKYTTLVDWSRFDDAYVSALIELRVTPQPSDGFESIARKVMKYDEVETVYLMSGGYDLCAIVTGHTFQEVAMFVAKELAPMKEVISTATHFVLKRYKELNVDLCGNISDDREKMSF
ncbi:MAG: Lrp/AsnC family transcriptional regulator [Clostridiales bacterium]|nr:Lrp/AsnC family transcriptional regulator [Clostridiales bacterium]